MDYVINPMWFYWIEVFNNIKELFSVSSLIIAIMTVFIGIVILANFTEGKISIDEAKSYIKKLIMPAIFGIIFIFGAIVVPSKDTMIKMVVAKNITYTNLEKSEDKIKDVVDYMFDKVMEVKNGNDN